MTVKGVVSISTGIVSLIGSMFFVHSYFATAGELEQLKDLMEDYVIKAFEPEHTRYNRKHTECAEWYYICKIDKETKLLTLTH